MELNINEKIVNLPGADVSMNIENIPTPKYDDIVERAANLLRKSNYQSKFDFKIYKELEQRFGLEQPRGGVVFKTPFRLVNSHPTCQQCLYSFEADTYGRGCTHDCVYCYAKAELTVHGSWNKPFPMPIDVTDIWNTFHTVFETDKKSKWRDVMEKRVPIRIGSMSDSFMWMDKKYKVTQEFLRILDFYNYPYIIFTRSDLVAAEPYMSLLNPNLCSVQMSISSTNDDLNKKIEPGTPSSKRRLKALQKLSQNGFWTTVRINPFFPIYADGYFTDPNFDKKNMPEPFHFSSFDMVDEIAAHGVQSVLTGMVRLSSFSINQLEKAVGRNIRSLYKQEEKKNTRDYHFSDIESRAYYERIHAKCLQNGIQFTTCYIGNGEKQFWRDQDLWSNKKDCCNAIGRVSGFTGTNSRDIKWETRLKYTNHKTLEPVSELDLHRTLGEIEKPVLSISNGSVTLNMDLIQ